MEQYLYLVVLSHNMDDVPLRLFADSAQAMEFAESCSWDVPDNLGRLLELPDADSPNVISLWTFRGGEPVSRVIVRTHEQVDWS